jgi:hypothetical protein
MSYLPFVSVKIDGLTSKNSDRISIKFKIVELDFKRNMLKNKTET